MEVVNIPRLKNVSCVNRQESNEYLIFLESKEAAIVNKLCGEPYSREKKDYFRYKTSKKTILTQHGALTHNFVYVKHKQTGKNFSPLLHDLNIEKGQRLSYDFKCVLVRKSGRTTYGDGVEDIKDSFEFDISRQTLHSYTQQICSLVNVEQGPNLNHKVLLADGTKIRSGKPIKHEVKSIISIGDSFDDKVLLKQAINKSWSAMVDELDLSQYDVFVGDGEKGLASSFTDKNIRFHFCHEHAKRDLAYYLWKDGLCKKEYNSYCNEFKGMLSYLQNSTKKHKKDEDWTALAFRIRWTKREVNTLAMELNNKNLVEASAFLRRNKDYLTTAAEMAILGIEVPWTTNGIERLMKEVGKRTKKKGMYWSEKGVSNVLKMVLKRYFLPQNQRTYKEIFALRKTEGIKF